MPEDPEAARTRPTGQVCAFVRAWQRAVLVCVVGFAGNGALAELPPGTPVEALAKPGLHSFTLETGGQSRRYLVQVPAGYDAARPTPVVFAFHGGGGDMHLQAGETYGIADQADRNGFIAVFPNGYSPLRSGKLATWNAGRCCAGARDKNSDDVGFVRALLARLKLQMNVDPARVFATGMSNGAMLTYRLACEMPEAFRAIAPVAGTDNTVSCTPASPVSVLHIHARDDTHVLFTGGAGPDAFRDESKVTAFTSVSETIARWVQRNQCTQPARKVLDKPGVTCEVYAGCARGSEVELCVTDTGGHSWPGATRVRRGKEPASQAISANEVMWDFFQRVSAR